MGSQAATVTVSALVVTHASAEHLPRLLPALSRVVDEIVVVDNASGDGTAEVARACAPAAAVVANHDNVGFARAVNQAAERASGTHLLLLNPDVRLTGESVAALVSAARRHPGDVVGPVVRDFEGRLQPTRIGRPTLWNLLGEQVLVPESAPVASWPARWWPRWRSYDHETPGPMLSGVCLLIPRQTWDAVGPLDPGYFLYWEEVDWQLRARAHGVRSWLVPSATIVHARSGSTGRTDPRRAMLLHASTRRFVRRWLPGHRRRAAMALLMLGQALRLVAWTTPPLRRRQQAAGRRSFHRAALAALRSRPNPHE